MTAAPVRKQIVAMGGGSFSAEPDGSALDAYVLALAGKPRPKICCRPDRERRRTEYATKFYDSFARRAEASHLYLFVTPAHGHGEPSREPGHHLRRAAGTPRTCSRCGACTAWTE
jgi:hypothetical protein